MERDPRRPLLCHPFPADILPDPLRRFVVTNAESIGCDSSFIALPALAALASAIGNTRQVRIKADWAEPPILWVGIVGKSGAGKSPAFDRALVGAHAAEKRAAAHNREAAATHDAEGGKAERLARRRHMVGDTTVEAIAPILRENPRGLLVARDELSGWLGSFNQYRARGVGGDEAHWLAMHSARPLQVDRKTGREHVYVPRAALCVAGGIQPKILRRALTAERLASGLGARLLLAMPLRKDTPWSDAVGDPAAEAAMLRLSARLYGLEPDPASTDDEMVPIDVPLSPSAREGFVGFVNRHRKAQAEQDDDLAAAYSKLEVAAARLSLVLQLVTDPDAREVGDDAMRRALDLVAWLTHEAHRVYAFLDENADQERLRLLAERLQVAGGEMPVRDVYRNDPRHYPQADDARKDLDRLRDAGLGDYVTEPSGPDGGRPSERFRFHVDIDKTDRTPEVSAARRCPATGGRDDSAFAAGLRAVGLDPANSGITPEAEATYEQDERRAIIDEPKNREDA